MCCFTNLILDLILFLEPFFFLLCRLFSLFNFFSLLLKNLGLLNSLLSEQTKNFFIPKSNPSTSDLNSISCFSIGTFSQEKKAYHSSFSFLIVSVFIVHSISLCFFIFIIPILETHILLFGYISF